MANKSADDSKVAVNGDNEMDMSIQNDIVMALANNGGIKRVEATLRQRLDEAGWSQDLREFATRLFRSGEAVTYDDALAIIMKNINSNGATANGSSEGVAAPDLSWPDDALLDGSKVLKKELGQIVKKENGYNAKASDELAQTEVSGPQASQATTQRKQASEEDEPQFWSRSLLEKQQADEAEENLNDGVKTGVAPDDRKDSAASKPSVSAPKPPPKMLAELRTDAHFGQPSSPNKRATRRP